MNPIIVFAALLAMVLMTGCGQQGPKGEDGICVVQPAPTSGVDVTCPDGTVAHVDDGDTFVCPTPEVVDPGGDDNGNPPPHDNGNHNGHDKDNNKGGKNG